ncbi:Putative transposable element [Caligus rogercresseyi]|uniref:Transposable element n=1 Tax=Caligus rogercresseyi TaxID=217165 RepID=A0A7T8GT82_CALRO|nr:Putative transposable element [Caligus rogercresseyi]
MCLKVIPWIRKDAGIRPNVVQQDGAPPHTFKVSQAFLDEKLSFWANNTWPSQSPDN